MYFVLGNQVLFLCIIAMLQCVAKEQKVVPKEKVVQKAISKDTSMSEEKLKKDLLKDYDNEIRARGANNTAVMVHVTTFGAIMLELRETEQIASYLLSHHQVWYDPRLTWDPSKYDGVSSIIVPKTRVWLPDTYIYNNIEIKDLVEEHKDFVKIEHDGRVTLNCPQYVKAFCTVGVNSFPFDTQFCTIAITSNQLDYTALDVKIHSPEYSPHKFSGNSEWRLQNVTMVYHNLDDSGIWGEPSLEYQYIFQIKRRCTYYITVIVIPIFLIATISIVGNFAPGSDNEPANCVNLGLATLLALMILLGIVADRLPKSDDMPLLAYYIISILVCYVFCVVFEIVMIYLSNKSMNDGNYPPAWLYKVARVKMGKFVRIAREEKTRKDKIKPVDEKNKKELEVQNANKGKENVVYPVQYEAKIDEFQKTQKMLQELIRKQDKILDKQGDVEKHDKIKEEWDKIEDRVDIFWIIVFESLNIFILCLFFIIGYGFSDRTIDDYLRGKDPVELLLST